MKKTIISILAIIILTFLITIYFYQEMPDRVASHWNARGDVDGYMPKFWGLFLIPFMLMGLTIFFTLIPKIDPLKKNIEKFRKYYEWFIILFCLFMLAVQIFVILWNIGIKISANILFPLSLGILFLFLGFILEKTKRNWFIGIRTPWTLSSDRVWSKTHRIGGKLFKICGIISIAAIFFQDYAIYFILIPVLLATAYVFIYSYIEYQKEK